MADGGDRHSLVAPLPVRGPRLLELSYRFGSHCLHLRYQSSDCNGCLDERITCIGRWY